jgi:ABC-type antimicrobial peptide transport system permease subunit
LVAFVFKQGAQQLALGLGAGVALGWAASKPARAAVSTVADSTDPFAYLLVLGVISVVVAIALWIPARRAAKSDPMLALRAE